MDSGSWLPLYGDGWYATLAEFDTWEGGFDFLDAPTTFDEAAAAAVSRTPLTEEERRMAAESTRGACEDAVRPDVRRAPYRMTMDEFRMREAWRSHDEVIAAQRRVQP